MTAASRRSRSNWNCDASTPASNRSAADLRGCSITANSTARPGVRDFPAWRKFRLSTTQIAVRALMNISTRTEMLAAQTVNDPRWAAVVARDAGADGKFFYSVKTTGVYCRPCCAARTPRPENVAFHSTAADARRAGFRPCKRCRPDQPSAASQQAALIADLCRRIENAEREPSL